MKKAKENLLHLICLFLFFLKAVKCTSCYGTGIYKRDGGENIGVVCLFCSGSGKVEKKHHLPTNIDRIEFFWEKRRRYDVEKVFIPIMGCIHSELTKGGVSYIDWFENNSPPVLSESYCPFVYFGNEDIFKCDLKSRWEKNFRLCQKFKDPNLKADCWREFIKEKSKTCKIPFEYSLPNIK